MSFESVPAESVRIRVENTDNAAECAAIAAVIEIAFSGSEEAELVVKLRNDGLALVSLVAEIDGVIVGHIMFSRMWISTRSGLVPAVALAPMAVLPEHQRKGIGQSLVRYGLHILRDRRESIVIVVGHPSYYPRFGFSADTASRLQSPFPREAFMAMELHPGALDGIEGSVVYPPAFGI
jgi:putative acetyltransferase